MPSDIGYVTMRKVERRIVPFCMLLFIVAFIDRINVGFAALEMNRALAIGSEAFGIGVGLFFVGYFLFEVPSNLILHRVGARLWIGRIVISWGALTALHAFVSGVYSFYALRFLLGLAEAGFAPGLLFYLTLWFPSRNRGAVMSRYLTASAIAVVIGAPFSTSLFHLSGVLGLAGWQWMFLIEGGLGVVLGAVTLRYLTDRPEDAWWLSTEERRWLLATLDAEPTAQRVAAADFRRALRDPRVWVLTFMFFCFGISSYGIIFWSPQIVRQLTGLSSTAIGFVTAIPWLAAVVVMSLVGMSSDRHGERHFHFAGSFVVGAIGLVGSVIVANPVLAMAFIGIGAVGIWSALGVFWTIPQQLFSGAAAAGCLALINSIGNLGGFVGPYMMGLAKGSTGTFSAGLIGLAGFLIAGAIAAVFLSRLPGRSASEEIEIGGDPPRRLRRAETT
jgi:ACS family tartrate transporter-like MFS transporter